MSGPDRVRIKRRRSELPPDTLIVEPGSKRKDTGAEHQLRGVLHYTRERTGDGDARLATSDTHAGQALPQTRRTFHLRQSAGRSVSVGQVASRKRKQKEEYLATFVELTKKARVDRVAGGAAGDHAQLVDSDQEMSSLETEQKSQQPPRLKRPGKGSTLDRKPPDTAVAATEKRPTTLDGLSPSGGQALVSMAEDLHAFAQAELASQPKPQLTARPKLSPARSRLLHQQRAVEREPRRSRDHQGDVDMDGGVDDYVYETYRLVPANGKENVTDVAQDDVVGNVGYLVIGEEVQGLWEAYMDEYGSDTSSTTDEDDENAEGYYGADYPEDELSSDDEHDRNALGYRGGTGSDDEQWDATTWSDEEEQRMMNPFGRKTAVPKHFSRFLGGKSKDDDDDEDD